MADAENDHISSSGSSPAGPGTPSDLVIEPKEEEVEEIPVEVPSSSPSGSSDDVIPISDAAIPVINDSDGFVTITCGLLVAKVHLNRFLCPGIHQPCIEYEGEFYSPKRFTIVAAKDKQKDWKGSIKVDRLPLRTLMERKKIDFFRHETYCSGKCASKNYRAMYKESGSGELGELYPHPDYTPPLGSSNLDTPDLSSRLSNFASGSATAIVKSDDDDELRVLPSQSLPLLSSPAVSSLLQGQESAEDRIATDDLMMNKPFQFWSGVQTLGLFPDLVSDLCSKIEEYRILFNSRPDFRPKIAERLSGVISLFEMSDQIRHTLHTKRILTRAESDILSNEIEELKKRTEEQKRRQVEAKRKSEIFDQLFSMAAKQPRFDTPDT